VVDSILISGENGVNQARGERSLPPEAIHEESEVPPMGLWNIQRFKAFY
jgi:hypothetical protein